MMKKLILIGLMIFLGGTNVVASDDGYLINKRAVFVSQMMPRMVGIVTMHGYELGISEKTMDIASNIRTKIKPRLKPLMKKQKQIEMKILKLSTQNDTHKQIANLIKELSKIKTKASLVQLDCVEMAKSKFLKKDIKIIKEFLNSKKQYMLKYHHVTMGR